MLSMMREKILIFNFNIAVIMSKTLLELFSGTKSVGIVADILGYDVISFD